MTMATNYGRDISVTTELRTGRFAKGLRIVAEAAFRRLTTPRGMLRGGEDEADYGLDLSECIGSAATKATAASLPGRIKSELLKDERIVDVAVDIVVAVDGPSTSYTITIEAEATEGPFTLQILASEVTVELLGIEAS